MPAKTESELRGECEKYGRRANQSAWTLVLVLVFEAALLWKFSSDKSLLETILFIASDLALAASIYGEIHWERKAHAASAELQRIADENVAEALARAAEANEKALEARLELERE